jgi:hypothetical protein
MVCVRLPHETRTGRRVQEVWNLPATTTAILELGDRLVCQGVARVVMEATGAYRKPYFFPLEARGLECWLVNACDVKNVPGRPRTDKLPPTAFQTFLGAEREPPVEVLANLRRLSPAIQDP